MLWLIQSNIYKEYNKQNLLNMLKRMQVPYMEINIVKGTDKIVSIDCDGTEENIKEKEVIIDSNKPVMMCGGNVLNDIAKKRNWKPGSFLNDNFRYDKWVSIYKDKLLNFESKIDTLNNIKIDWNEFFIRPIEDTKYFNGTVFSKESFKEWKEEIIKKDCSFVDTEVVASPIKDIYAEYRLFVVDKRIVTHSQYKSGENVYLSENVGQDVLDFTNKMIDIWQPARAFVIDVAFTSEGFKIIEFNNINASGFYNCNVGKFIEAIEYMDF